MNVDVNYFLNKRANLEKEYSKLDKEISNLYKRNKANEIKAKQDLQDIIDNEIDLIDTIINYFEKIPILINQVQEMDLLYNKKIGDTNE